MRGVRSEAERGDAIVEFIGLAIVVVIPLVYLILLLADVHAAALATHTSAREAERILAAHPAHTRAAQVAVDAIVADQGIAHPARLEVICDGPCRRGGAGTVRVTTRVGLPLLPGFVREALPAFVPVSAETVVYFSQAGPQ